MAIQYLGYEHITDTGRDGSTTITIPANTDFIFISAVVYDTSSPNLANQFTSLSINSNECTHIISGKFTSFPVTDMWYLLPGFTGSHTLAWTGRTEYSDPVDRGRHFYIVYFSGVDQAAPIRDSAAAQASGSATINIGPVDSSTSDILIAATHSYLTIPDIEYDGLTVIEESSVYNSIGAGIGYRLGVGSIDDQDVSGDYPVAALVSIKASGGSGGLVVVMDYRRRMSQ